MRKQKDKGLNDTLNIEPAGHFINWQQDPFANYQARLVFPDKTREFKVTMDLVVEMAVYNPFDFFLEPSAETVPLTYAPELREELAPYLVCAPELAKAPLFTGEAMAEGEGGMQRLKFESNLGLHPHAWWE